jgi:ribonuclease HI
MEKHQQEKIIVHTDGGSRGNPGPAAIGVVIQDSRGNPMKTYGKTVGVRTNNEAEYEAVVFALLKVKALVGGVRAKKVFLDVFMDSELVKRQLSGEYKIEQERLFPLFIKIWNLRIDFGSVLFNHIPREKNKEADRLVNEALDKEQKSLF